jgi:hypothetical protein
MFKLRQIVVTLCVLVSLMCVVWAAKKQTAGDKCDFEYASCETNCRENYTGAGLNICFRRCKEALDACYKKAGLPPPKPAAVLPPGGTSGLPTAQPVSSPKIKVNPQGTLTQASPSPSPKRLTRQPQGSLTQASPSASPKVNVRPQGTLTQASPAPTTGKIYHERKKGETTSVQPQGSFSRTSPSATPRKRHHDQEKKKDH